MTRGEIWKDFFKKTVLTVLIAGVLFYWATLVFTKDGATNYFYVWLCCGIPFGIRRMFVWLIPRGFDLSGTVGVVALNFIPALHRLHRIQFFLREQRIAVFTLILLCRRVKNQFSATVWTLKTDNCHR